MMFLWYIISFFASSPLDFSWSKCMQSTPEQCADLMINYSSLELERFLKPKCFESKINQACLSLGKAYKAKGQEELASATFAYACGHNLKDACLEGGWAYDRSGNKNQANHLFSYGCYKLNNMESCESLASNKRAEGNYFESYELYLKSCNGGRSNGCLQAIDTSIFAKLNTDYNLMNLQKKACDLDEGSACLRLGFIFQEQNDLIVSSSFFKKACLLNEPDGCSMFKEINNGGYIQQGIRKGEGLIHNFIERNFPLEK